jgi:DNA repair protein RadA/Sms
MEGRRPLLAEVQALVTRSAAERPRRTTSGLDSSRVAMVLAVLQQHCNIRLHAHDVFVSTVGGARLSDPASDLAVAVALASATTGAPAPTGVAAIGEIGLAGELRRVRDLPQRVAEAARLGFRTALVPGRRDGVPRTIEGMELVEVTDVASALRSLELAATTRPRLRPLD